MANKQGEEEQTCPVCLKHLKSHKGFQELGKPSSCDHVFCYLCIFEWSKNMNTCPVDRLKFNHIDVYTSLSGDPVRTIKVRDTSLSLATTEDATYCEICNECTREDCLLLCDGCDRGYHLDCLAPPLSEVPADDWYCTSCERIVQSQYLISVTSEGESDSAYVPRTNGVTFHLDLSSDVDITGSDSESVASCMVMSLDSEPEPDSSDYEEEEVGETTSAVSYPFPQVMSEATEDVFVDVTEDASDHAGHTSFSSASSSLLKSSQVSHKALNGSCTAPRPFDRRYSMNDSSSGESDVFSKRQKRPTSNMNLGSPSSSDTSVVIVGQTMTAKRRRGIQRDVFSDESNVEIENLELGISRKGNENGNGPSKKAGEKRNTSRKASEDGNSPSRKGGEKGNSPSRERNEMGGIPSMKESVKGKSPLLLAGKNRSKKFHFPGGMGGSGVSETHAALLCANRDPMTFSDTIILSSDDDLVRRGGHTTTLFNGHSPLPGPSQNAVSSDEGQRHVRPAIQHGVHTATLLNDHASMPGPSEKPLLPNETSASSAGRNRGNGNKLAQQGRKRPRKRRKKIVQNVGTRRKAHNIRKNRRKKLSKKRRVGHGNAFAVGTTVSMRSRARTVATHTPRKNIMRAAVVESYRHDNQMEGLEWARAILAKATSGTPPRHRSEFFQNLPTPTSGYVERTGVSKLQGSRKTSQDTMHDTSPPISRMYGFTPSRKQHIRPSLVSSSLASNPTPPNQNYFFGDSVPLPDVINGMLNGLVADPKHAGSSQDAKKKHVTAQQRMFKEANQRLSKCAKVLITPVKYRSKGDHEVEGGGSLSSSSEPATCSLDPLGDMWRGLEVLEGQRSIIRRDGTIAPCGSPPNHNSKAQLPSVHTIGSASGPESGPLNSDWQDTNSTSDRHTAHRPRRDAIVQDPIMRRQGEMEMRSHSTVQARGRHLSDSSLGTSSGSGYEQRPHPSRINMGDNSGPQVPPSPNDDGAASSKGLHGYTIPKLVKPTPDTESTHPGNGTNLGSTPPTRFKRSCSAFSTGGGRVQRSRKKKQCFCGSDSKRSVKSSKPPRQYHGEHNHSVPGHLPRQKHTDSTADAQTAADLEYNVTRCSPPGQTGTDFEYTSRSPPVDFEYNVTSRSPQVQKTDSKYYVTACRPSDHKAIQDEEEFFNSVSGKTMPPDGHTSDFDGGNSSSNSLTKFSFTCLRSWQGSDSDTPKSVSTETFPLTEPTGQSELDSKECIMSRVECGQAEHNQPHLAQSNPESSGDNFKSVIRKALDMYFDQGKITNRQYKRILERATRRVRDGLKICSLNEKQVIKLVADYVKAYKSCAVQVT